MNANVQLHTYAGARLPLRMPVLVEGRPAHICGRAFGHEHYDVVFDDNSVANGVPRETIEPDWRAIRT